MTVAEALTIAGPYYNLAFAIIVLFLFGKLFTGYTGKKAFLRPWYFLFAAVIIFILEEVITVLRASQVLDITIYINGFFELAIISLFIYTLMILREHVK